MKTRVITAIIALALFVGILLLPPIVFTIALAAVIFVMLYECYRATKADNLMKFVGGVSSIMMMLVMYPIFKFKDVGLVFVFITATAILLLYMTIVIIEHNKRNYKDILSSGFLTLYITVSMWCVLFVRDFFETEMMLLIFIAAWSCDTFAYFSGRLFGKHKLIPRVSPNKTVEGAIGGVIGAIIGCLIYLFILYKLQIIDYIVNIGHWVLYFAAVGFVGAL